MNKVLRLAPVLAGLGVIVWVALGYVGNNPLALTITALIGAFYLLGLLELLRYQQGTGALARALDELTAPPAALRAWLERVPAGLQNAVRRRVEGEPVGLPGPALTPTLAGLLVLMGMLGTFLGMVLTLRGTGAALEGAADLVAVRNSLVAPVKGLGLAFGTSVAGVAASAALGLLSALLRRERAEVSQRLDASIATNLRGFSVAHQRETSLTLLQRQTELMPALVDKLQTLMDHIERQAETSQARLLASQDQFQQRTEAVYAGLAASVAQTLQTSLTDSARLAGDTIRPVAEATLAGIAHETAQLHAALAGTMQTQLDQLSGRFEANAASVTQAWQALMLRHEQVSGQTAAQVQASHERFVDALAQRSADLVDGVATRLDATVQRVSDGWGGALAEQARVNEQLAGDTRQALTATVAAFEQQAAELLRTLQQAQTEQQIESAQRDQQRVAATTQVIETMAASLRQEWQLAGAQTLEQQQRVCEMMERTAREVTTQAEAQARAMSAEIARLVAAASEAPRAAADVIAELRQKLSDSMARDNTLLDERARMLDTLGTLLDGVNRAATEQRGAIDALVASSASMLERVGERFNQQIDAEAGKLAEVAAQVTGSAADVASLGEAFGAAVQSFSESSQQLGAQLQRIEGALSASMSRSDEQLAYYVAQAREVIDLSILSQKQIIDDLQRLSHRAAAEATA